MTALSERGPAPSSSTGETIQRFDAVAKLGAIMSDPNPHLRALLSAALQPIADEQLQTWAGRSRSTIDHAARVASGCEVVTPMAAQGVNGGEGLDLQSQRLINVLGLIASGAISVGDTAA